MEEKKEKKLIQLVQNMVPEVKAKETIEDIMLGLVEVVNKRNIALDEALKAQPKGSVPGDEQTVKLLLEIKGSLQNLKEQFSTMRQYGIGVSSGK